MTDNQDKYKEAGILIVDDNPTNVQLLEMMLEMEGFSNVQSTTDSRQVLELQQQQKFDLILLDIQMPHLDGFQVMEQLRSVEESDYLPVLVLTAQQDMQTRLRALESGAKDFVTKPFDRSEVLNRIYNMLEVRFLYNERLRQAEELEIKVNERTQQLQDSRLELIRRLGRAGEYRDNETGMHVIRMSKSCHCLALQAGLGEEMAELILLASPMKLARLIALTHHEKWDGTGYPAGLKGEEIPIAGRIASICDVFDALTSERPYKKGWPVEDAIKFINDNAGSQFDRTLVRHFNAALSKILEIMKLYADVQ